SYLPLLSFLHDALPISVPIHRLPSGSKTSVLTRSSGSAPSGSRSKSRPVQRATPSRVPTQTLPSGATSTTLTAADGRLRGSLSRSEEHTSELQSRENLV